ncbi:unnamed protein product, partial [Nippostrongylus brasiliensis]|uniref:EF-hand_14 domain-containing protein n=1 Tax=Nippostrongylus brasiliensis TaxID=27835 RepID=A0A0N4XGS6_NIPBR
MINKSAARNHKCFLFARLQQFVSTKQGIFMAHFEIASHAEMMLDCSGSRTDSSELCEETLDKIGEILEQRKKCVKQIMSKTVEGLKNAYDVRLPTSPADLIFDLFKVPNKDYASITKLIKVLKSFGLREKDPRLKEMMTRIRTIEDLRQSDHNSGFHLRRHAFKECIAPAILLISQVLRSQMIIPSWEEFCGRIK